VEATPGLPVLAPIRTTRGKPARGAWGPAYRLTRAVVERVERTPEGTLVSVRFGNGVRRKVLRGAARGGSAGRAARMNETTATGLTICAGHTPDQPSGYREWHAWAARMSKTHRQVRCPACGRFEVWVPKQAKRPPARLNARTEAFLEGADLR
jgi:hypothetical protein